MLSVSALVTQLPNCGVVTERHAPQSWKHSLSSFLQEKFSNHWFWGLCIDTVLKGTEKSPTGWVGQKKMLSILKQLNRRYQQDIQVSKSTMEWKAHATMGPRHLLFSAWYSSSRSWHGLAPAVWAQMSFPQRLSFSWCIRVLNDYMKLNGNWHAWEKMVLSNAETLHPSITASFSVSLLVFHKFQAAWYKCDHQRVFVH